jgi:hypothetical protein
MTAHRPLVEVNRQELYDLIWSKPGTKLSSEFGVSDVAIAKRCRKLNIPRPSRGYWAKIDAGHKPRKPPLPPTADELFLQAAEKPVAKSLPLSKGLGQLHPLAAELMKALSAGKPDVQKRINIRESKLPEVTVTKALAERAAKAFNVIMNEVEPRGIVFRKSRSSYDAGYFQKGHDRLYLEIEEELVEGTEELARGKRRQSSYYGHTDRRVPSGNLTFSLKTDRYAARETKRWKEGAETGLSEVLAQTVQEICRHYVEAQKRRAQEAIEQERRRMEWEESQKKWREEEAIRRKEEREQKHAEAIETTMRHRKDDLLKAAEWWRLHEAVQGFISACEQRWRTEQTNDLKPDQEEWLEWARKTAESLCPFESGYPEPDQDGAFSPLTVPLGGPYPATREFSRPPTMPKIPAPVVVQQGYGSSPQPSPDPYPFWLKYPRR